MQTGNMSSALFWFKTKLMKVVNPSWDYLKKASNNYYTQCSVDDKAMGYGLYILKTMKR